MKKFTLLFMSALVLSSCNSAENKYKRSDEPIVFEVRDFTEEKRQKELEKIEKEKERQREIERKKQEEIKRNEKVANDIKSVMGKVPYTSKANLIKSVKELGNDDMLIMEHVNKLETNWVTNAVNVIITLLNTDDTLTDEDLKANLLQLGFTDEEVNKAIQADRSQLTPVKENNQQTTEVEEDVPLDQEIPLDKNSTE